MEGDIYVWEAFMCGGDIYVWEAFTCGGDIYVWEAFTCETSHQSEILHSLIFRISLSALHIFLIQIKRAKGTLQYHIVDFMHKSEKKQQLFFGLKSDFIVLWRHAWVHYVFWWHCAGSKHGVQSQFGFPVSCVDVKKRDGSSTGDHELCDSQAQIFVL